MMAKHVEVVKLFRAHCKLCPWHGPLRGTFQGASDDRKSHMQVHVDEGREDQPLVNV